MIMVEVTGNAKPVRSNFAKSLPYSSEMEIVVSNEMGNSRNYIMRCNARILSRGLNQSAGIEPEWMV